MSTLTNSNLNLNFENAERQLFEEIMNLYFLKLKQSDSKIQDFICVLIQQKLNCFPALHEIQ